MWVVDVCSQKMETEEEDIWKVRKKEKEKVGGEIN